MRRVRRAGIWRVRARQIRGMTLVEVMVAIGIVSLLLVSVFNILPSTLLAVSHAQEQYIANQVVQTVLEQQRATLASKMSTVSNKKMPKQTVNNIEFTPFLTITTIDNSVTPPLMMISVTVQWQSGNEELVTGAQLEVTDVTAH